jgi:hypothetical protein
MRVQLTRYNTQPQQKVWINLDLVREIYRSTMSESTILEFGPNDGDIFYAIETVEQIMSQVPRDFW